MVVWTAYSSWQEDAMSDWTTEYPKVGGWYWLECEGVAVLVSVHGESFFVASEAAAGGFPPLDMKVPDGAKWAGPILPPPITRA